MPVTKVVILNWNGRQHLERFLPSVLASTPKEIEVVVADNGSTDDSCDYLRQCFPQVRVIQLDRNYGFAEGYDRVLEQLEADYFVLLNSDVETPEGWIQPLVETLEQNPDMAALAPKLRAWTERDQFEYAGAAGGFIDALGYPFCRGRILSNIEMDQGQYDDARDVFWASGACLMFRASVFRELGGFDARFFAHMEEIDLCWRAQLAGYRIGIEPRSVVYHLGGGTLAVGSAGKTYLNFRNNLAMLYKNLPEGRLYMTLLCRMLLDGGSALVWLLTGKWAYFKAVVRAHRDFYRWLPELRKQRRQIQACAVSKARFIYKGSILLRYMMGHKRFGHLF